MLATLLGLSLLGLMLGPLLAALGRGRRELACALDGFTLGVVPALVVARLLPHTWSTIGAWSLIAASAGYALLWATDSVHSIGASRLGRDLVIPALAVHALSDGAALSVAVSARSAGSAGWLLGAAVVLHRLPEGLFLATTLAPSLGPKRAAARIALLGLATVVGALVSSTLLAQVPEAAFDLVTAFGLGAMLRLVLHTHGERPEGPSARAIGGLAMGAGVALALAIPAPHDILRIAQPLEFSIAESILPLFVETAPALLLGVIAAALLHVHMPRLATSALAGKSPLGSALLGIRFGVGLPICSCGVRPMSRRLAEAGAPASAAVAFALATPELALDALPMSIRVLGWPLTLARLAIAATMALLVGVIVDRIARSSTASFGPPTAPEELELGPTPRLVQTLIATFDHTGAWYLAGLLIAAALEAALPIDAASRLPLSVALPMVLLLSLPAYICAPGATPIAAMLLHKGFSPGIVLAFLAIGPTLNFALLATWRDLFGRRAALIGALACVAFSAMVGVAAHLLTRGSSAPALHPMVAHSHGMLELLASAALAILLAWSVTRLGARGFLESLLGEIGARDEACDHPGHAGHEQHGHSH